MIGRKTRHWDEKTHRKEEYKIMIHTHTQKKGKISYKTRHKEEYKIMIQTKKKKGMISHLIDRENLPITLFHLLELPQKIPIQTNRHTWEMAKITKKKTHKWNPRSWNTELRRTIKTKIRKPPKPQKNIKQNHGSKEENSIFCGGLDLLPELRFGANLVRRPELHPVDLGVLVAFRRKSSTHHLVLMELPQHE